MNHCWLFQNIFIVQAIVGRWKFNRNTSINLQEEGQQEE